MFISNTMFNQNQIRKEKEEGGIRDVCVRFIFVEENKKHGLNKKKKEKTREEREKMEEEREFVRVE